MHLIDIDEAWLDLSYSMQMEDPRINDHYEPTSIRYADKTTAIIKDQTPYKFENMCKERTENGYRLYDFVEMPF